MGIFDKFKRNKAKDTYNSNALYVTLNINERLLPEHRFPIEDNFDQILQQSNLGSVTGGGTLQMATGEIQNCDIEIELNNGTEANIAKLLDIINAAPIAKGSFLYIDEKKYLSVL